MKTKQAIFMIFGILLMCIMLSCSNHDDHTHSLIKIERQDATCLQEGNIEYWKCTECLKLFSDEACQNELLFSDTVLTGGTHLLIYHPRTEGEKHKNGYCEHWSCQYCAKIFSDSEGVTEISKADITLPAPLAIDFIVEVEEGRDPVILQLTDTQIIDSAQARTADRLSEASQSKYAIENVDRLCYDYIREAVETVKPDLIILTGDIVYGEFDDNGEVLLDFVEFMESLNVPWAPIFGNHDNESVMGVDWQCEQLVNAKNCLFKQRELTGNGNYTVGIEQGGELKRVFFMLDSNGCSNASAESLQNGHMKTTNGFGEDQIAWYTELATQINAQSPDTKLSFAFHIQLQVFATPLVRYGFTNTDNNPIYLDRLKKKADTDFGHVGRKLKGAWDSDYTVWKGLKALGVDSIFVGHEHCNSASVVYSGVRLQYGQKSSEYDRYNYLATDGSISSDYSAGAIPLVGGTVIPLSEADGSIKDPYIFYCKEAGGSVDWSQWENSK